MTKKDRLLLALLGSCASIVAMPSVGFAAEAAVDPQAAEIIVTATRRDQRLMDVPMSVDVATGDQLQKLNLFDTKDISALSPGLELTNSTGRNNTTTLRGISFDPDQGTGPAVQVFLNEIPTDAQTVYTALYDVAQFEVLRGPQGLLRGLSAPAGAITIKTRRPGFDAIDGYVQATGTEQSAYNVQGGISLPFSGQFAVRAAVLVDGNRLNQVENVNRGDESKSTTLSGRLTLGWKPSEAFQAYLTYQYLEADNRQQQQVFGPGNAPSLLAFGDPTRSGPLAAVSDYIAVAEGITRFRNTSHIINLAADWDLGPAMLSFVGAHQDTKLDQQRDLDSANAVPNYTNVQHVQTPYNVDTAELRLTSAGEGAFGWGVGAFYTSQSGTTVVDQKADNFFGPFPVSFGLFLPINVRTIVPVDSSTLSFNANARAKFGKLTIEGGVRYSIIKSTQTGQVLVSSPGYPGFPAFGIPAIAAFNVVQDIIPPALQETDEKPITGGATITFEASDELSFYASYGHSFRAGSAGVAVPAGISNDLIRSDNEKTDSFEIGVKTALMDRRLNITVAGFYQKFDGFLSRFDGIFYNCRDFFGSCNAFGPPINNATDVPLTNGSFSFNYNGDATVKGIEARIDARPIDTWDISLNLSYARARYDDALLPCNDFNGDGIPDANGTPRITGTGNVSLCKSSGRLADVPDFNMSATTEFRFPVGDLTPFVRGLFTYRPSLTSERFNFDFESRSLLNVYLGVRGADDRWEINVFAKNMFNQQRITAISQGNAQQPTSSVPYDSGYRTINATNPREFGLTAGLKF